MDLNRGIRLPFAVHAALEWTSTCVFIGKRRSIWCFRRQGLGISAVPFARSDGETIAPVDQPLHSGLRAIRGVNDFRHAVTHELDSVPRVASLVGLRTIQVCKRDLVLSTFSFDQEKGSLRAGPSSAPSV